MDWVGIDTREPTRKRFEDLCERLSDADKGVDPAKVLGHLLFWYCRWAGDMDLDTGIFFDATEARLGQWAQWPIPKQFGHALVGVGYASSLTTLYSEEVLAGRSGYCVPHYLDVCWTKIHIKRGEKHWRQYAPFLLDERRRGEWNADRVGMAAPGEQVRGAVMGPPARVTETGSAGPGNGNGEWHRRAWAIVGDKEGRRRDMEGALRALGSDANTLKVWAAALRHRPILERGLDELARDERRFMGLRNPAGWLVDFLQREGVVGGAAGGQGTKGPRDQETKGPGDPKTRGPGGFGMGGQGERGVAELPGKGRTR